jgi:hypothetical protein
MVKMALFQLEMKVWKSWGRRWEPTGRKDIGGLRRVAGGTSFFSQKKCLCVFLGLGIYMGFCMGVRGSV